MGRSQFTHAYEYIISPENLLLAWQEFAYDKHRREDVLLFERNLMGNIFDLHGGLVGKTYRHGAYHAFNISDPKPRNIHKASVRDRLLHHAIYRILHPFFDRTFIADSYSCRLGRGTHRAMDSFCVFGYQVSKNHTKTAWVLKCDIRKFFASIDHKILLDILARYILDDDILWLLERVIKSFHSTAYGKGLPLGNLTSQLLVNIYMNEFDQFVKHQLKAKYYIRYADDFVFLSHNRDSLEILLPKIGRFLCDRLKLELHPDKVSVKTIASGVDFLGWVHFPDHRVLRTATKRRMLRGIERRADKVGIIQSYLGLMSYGNAHRLIRRVSDRLHKNEQ